MFRADGPRCALVHRFGDHAVGMRRFKEAFEEIKFSGVPVERDHRVWGSNIATRKNHAMTEECGLVYVQIDQPIGLHLESEKSIFNLNCINATEFPLTDENFTGNEKKYQLENQWE